MEKYKYPRTYHLPYSKGATADDKILKDDSIFDGMYVVVTEKMDGENSTIYKNSYHARSLDSSHKQYHSWLLAYIRNFQYLLPDDFRICGEYLYATHSIHYSNLNSYFLGFSVWEKERCLAWEETEEFLDRFGIETVPVLYKGIYNVEKIKKIAEDVVARGGEGIVVRNIDSFEYKDFSKNVAKYVRENHVTTDDRWDQKAIVPNKLKKRIYN